MTQAFQSAVTPLLMKWFRTLCLLSFSPEIRIANKHKTVISNHYHTVCTGLSPSSISKFIGNDTVAITLPPLKVT